MNEMSFQYNPLNNFYSEISEVGHFNNKTTRGRQSDKYLSQFSVKLLSLNKSTASIVRALILNFLTSPQYKRRNSVNI